MTHHSLTTSQRWVVGLTAISALLVGLDTTVVATALTTLRLDLHASTEQLEWTVNAYTLSFAVLLLTAAALGDRFGRRRIFLLGLAVFAVASAGCAAAPDAGWLIAARAVQGAGAAAVMPLALTLLGAAVSPATRARALGMFSAVVGTSVPLGPVLGGAIADGTSWRWIFWINVPLAAILIGLVLTRISPSAGVKVRLDLPGLLLSSGAALGLVWGLVRANTAGWTGPETLLTLGAGVVLTVAFLLVERRTDQPMLPLRLFGVRAFAAGNAAIFFVWASAFSSVYFMAQFFQVGLSTGPLEAGLRLVPWGAMTALVPRLVGSLIPRYGERPFIVGGMLLHGLSMVWIAAVAAPGVAYWELVAPLILSGIGVAASIPATQSAVLGAVAPPDLGKASGAYGALRQLGGAFGVAAVVAVFAVAGGYASPADFVGGFTPALVGCAALAVGAALAGTGTLGRRITAQFATPAVSTPSQSAGSSESATASR
ncbi:MAG: MFS transporter [Hamadaea sp.]|uniref:MFS transporter n=1 Tax=Hamadaea sp. TaxID=2024425 RepID=UPI0017C58AC0|nr:MFS transporter [Hamadaea sp.]NUR71732.1 MFS transporter [Hamadaea sp.]NUT19046.1 MFS transporter [Hamadaea sp.]